MEHVGLEALENEVAEKKRIQLFGAVAKACSVGAQMTLIMGGGALLFRWDVDLVFKRRKRKRRKKKLVYQKRETKLQEAVTKNG